MSLLQLFEEIKQKEWIEIPEGWLQGANCFWRSCRWITHAKGLLQYSRSK